MSRLTDAFDALIARYPEPSADPDAIFAGASATVAAGRTRRRALVGLATAAALVVAVALAALVVTDDEPTDGVRAGPAPATTSTPEPAITPGATVQVFFTPGTDGACRATEGVDRTLPPDAPTSQIGLLDAALDLLLQGPTPQEQADGLTSFFDTVSDPVREISVRGGEVTVDFDPTIIELTPNASTACGSASILAQLEATVGQFGFEGPTFSIGGDPEAFDAWLGIDRSGEPPTGQGPLAQVVASSDGVELRTLDAAGGPATTSIATSPAAAAYAVGPDLVVFQGLDPDTAPGDRLPPWPGGTISMWTRQGNRVAALSIGKGRDRTVLLDATTLDGRPVALVAVHRGSTPDDSFESLTVVDLDSGEESVVVEQPSWEAGTVQARLLPDGDVVAVGTGEASWSVARWSTRTDQPTWTTQLASDTVQTLAVLDDEAAIATASVGSDRWQVSLRSLDLDSGALGAEQTIDVSADAAQIGSLWCGDWSVAGVLSCANATGSAFALDEDGAVADLATPPGAIVTPAR